MFGELAGAGRVRCTLCPFRCVLGDGQAGVCQVRRNDGGVLRTATYTAAVAHLTAVERKPLYHVRPGAQVLTVAGPGCSFRCDYCINFRLSQYGRDQDAPWLGEPAGRQNSPRGPRRRGRCWECPTPSRAWHLS